MTNNKNPLPPFPAGIHEIQESDVPRLLAALTDHGRYDAETTYVRLSNALVAQTGYQNAVGRDGKPYTRAQWEDVLHKSLSYLNRELSLGMDREVLDVMALCYATLSGATRFGNESLISREAGENTAVHSLHTFLQAQIIYQKALEESPELKKDVQFFRNFQATCLMMAVHDFGEMLGEACSLAQAMHAGSLDYKDKSAYERAVFNTAVRCAVSTVTSGLPKEKFYEEIDRLRGGVNVADNGHLRSDEDLTSNLGVHAAEPYPLNDKGEELFNFLLAAWDAIEKPSSSPMPFVGNVAGTCERIQGSRHFNRHMPTSQCTITNPDGTTATVLMANLTPAVRMIANAEYTEGKLAALCASTDESILRETAVRDQALVRAYETQRDFFKNMSEAFFRLPIFTETRLPADGSPYDLQTANRRRDEIALARDVAEREFNHVLDSAAKTGGLTGEFNCHSVDTGYSAVKAAEAVELYQYAANTRFKPSMVRVNGRETGQILIRDLPAAVAFVGSVAPGVLAEVERASRDYVRDRVAAGVTALKL